MKDKFYECQLINGLVFLLMQDLCLPTLLLLSEKAEELQELDSAPKSQSWLQKAGNEDKGKTSPQYI